MNVIRVVTADDWPQAKELRLAALRDPVAHLAFLDTYANALGKPDVLWKEQAANSEAGVRSRQFAAVAPEGGWVGSVAGIVEDAGEQDYFGLSVEERQVQLVGVFVRPEHRGGGRVLGPLVAAVREWAGEVGAGRLRLFVHAGNGRAVAAYERLGFKATGHRAPDQAGTGEELEYVWGGPLGPAVTAG
ncbi:GNAT family N-acetyltransferase [Streptomyces sp. SID11385]|uniref:GNAT family N-acetyltransferase n=1 Tax=Streptomyces sp. SID11385 TaxID=2706031 RepID=UPI0013C55ED4|nr:GNAT family N-acetyltransferase [Streptomyces sp. SID11385]NEA41656.1 N-acetyltransferase [Streptomyces sp. SID11385]